LDLVASLALFVHSQLRHSSPKVVCLAVVILLSIKFVVKEPHSLDIFYASQLQVEAVTGHGFWSCRDGDWFFEWTRPCKWTWYVSHCSSLERDFPRRSCASKTQKKFAIG
jgi:hypothetical protein